MNTNKREEKILLELEDYVRAEKRRSDSSTYIYGQGESNAFEKVLKKISELTTSLPQNGDRENPAKGYFGTCPKCGLIFGEPCPKCVPSPSEGDREKEEGGKWKDKCKNCGKEESIVVLAHLKGLCGSCFYETPSEGKEKEPNEEMVEIPFSVAEDIVHSSLAEKEPKFIDETFDLTEEQIAKLPKHVCGKTSDACIHSSVQRTEKETAPKTDWAERFDEKFYDPFMPHEKEIRKIKAFIQTLLKEKEEDAYRKGYDEGFYNGQNIKPF